MNNSFDTPCSNLFFVVAYCSSWTDPQQTLPTVKSVPRISTNMTTTTTTTTAPGTIPWNRRNSSNDLQPRSEAHPTTAPDKPPVLESHQVPRFRSNTRFRSQPMTLTEIYEVEEDDQVERDRFEQLTLDENLRRLARKKLPTKNFLQRQRLKTTREELNENEEN